MREKFSKLEFDTTKSALLGWPIPPAGPLLSSLDAHGVFEMVKIVIDLLFFGKMSLFELFLNILYAFP